MYGLIQMIKFLSKILNLLYKKRCYFCAKSKDDSVMCESCYKKTEFLPYKKFKTLNNVDIYCAAVYKNNIKKLIRGLKYHNQRELAYFQAKIMYDYWENLKISQKEFVLVPVPLFPKREKHRKYNHMQLVANEFEKLTQGKCNTAQNLIKRIKNTKPQYKLTRKEREKNLKDAFELTDGCEEFKGRNILILDDIFTTGTTLKEMIKTFQTGGFENICCFTTSCSEYSLSHL